MIEDLEDFEDLLEVANRRLDTAEYSIAHLIRDNQKKTVTIEQLHAYIDRVLARVKILEEE